MSRSTPNDNIQHILQQRGNKLRAISSIPKKMILGILILLLLRTMFVLPITRSSYATANNITFSKAITQRYEGKVPDFSPTRSKFTGIYTAHHRLIDLFNKTFDFDKWKYPGNFLLYIFKLIIGIILYALIGILLIPVSLILIVLSQVISFILALGLMLVNLLSISIDRILPQLNILLVWLMIGACFGAIGAFKRISIVPRVLFFIAVIGIYIYSVKYLNTTGGVPLDVFYK